MAEYEVKNYGVFSDAVTSTKTFGTSISGVQDAVNGAKTTLSDTSIFQGPAQENCMSVLSGIETAFSNITTNYQTIENYLTGTSTNYQAGDAEASSTVASSTDTTSAALGQGAVTTSTTASGVLDYKVGNLPTEGSQASSLGRKATLLDVQVDGHSLGQDGSIVIKKGQTVHLKVKIPDEIQNVQTLKRTSVGGAKGWSQWVSQESNPNVDKNNPNTYANGREYDWYITGKTTTGNVTLSQTALFSIPGARLGSYKGMVRVRVQIVD